MEPVRVDPRSKLDIHPLSGRLSRQQLYDLENAQRQKKKALEAEVGVQKQGWITIRAAVGSILCDKAGNVVFALDPVVALVGWGREKYELEPERLSGALTIPVPIVLVTAKSGLHSGHFARQIGALTKCELDTATRVRLLATGQVWSLDHLPPDQVPAWVEVRALCDAVRATEPTRARLTEYSIASIMLPAVWVINQLFRGVAPSFMLHAANVAGPEELRRQFSALKDGSVVPHRPGPTLA